MPPTVPLPPPLLMAAHLALIGIQVVGSVWINRLSPSWERTVGRDKASWDFRAVPA